MSTFSGTLPSDWRVLPLREVCEIISGSTPSRERTEYWGGSIRWATPRDISNLNGKVLVEPAERITKAGYDSCSARMLPKGAVLFSSRAPIGLVAIAGAELCTNQGFKSFVPGPEVDSDYLFHYLKTHAPRIDAMGNGATFKEVSRAVIGEFPLLLPPLPQQRRIAAMLDKADAVRRKRKEAIALTEELLRSAFLEMFGDPVTNPRDWPIVVLKAVAEVQGGLQVTHTREVLPLRTPYLRVANVFRDRLWLDEVKLIGLTEPELTRTRLEAGDILVVEGHGNTEEIGRAAMWDGSIQDCVHQNHLIRVRVAPEKASAAYVSAFLNSEGGRRQMKALGKTTSGLNTISTNNVRSLVLLHPPLSEQLRFADIYNACKVATARMTAHLVTTEVLFNSLVHRAFRGEL